MNNPIFLFLCTVSCSCLFGQQNDSIQPSYKFRKERSAAIRTIKAGKTIQVELNDSLDQHYAYGRLVSVSDSILTLDLLYESSEYSVGDYRKSIEEVFDIPKRSILPFQSVEYLYRDRSALTQTPVLMAWGFALCAAVVAPLMAIDKSAPDNFNTHTYKQMLGISLIGMSAGIVLHIVIGKDDRYKLRVSPGLN